MGLSITANEFDMKLQCESSKKPLERVLTSFAQIFQFICYLDSIMNDIDVFFKTVLKSMAIFF